MTVGNIGGEVNTSVQVTCVVFRVITSISPDDDILYLTLQRGVTGTARMLHALTHSSISRQVREQM